MAYDAVTVANTMIQFAKTTVGDLSPMKRQKLLFYAHGWHLAFYKKPLIKNHFEAWRFGPVVNELYHEFKHCGRNPVNAPPACDLVPKTDIATHHIISEVFRVYGHFTAVELSDLTHEPGTPWHDIYEDGGEIIPNDLIQRYFLSLDQS